MYTAGTPSVYSSHPSGTQKKLEDDRGIWATLLSLAILLLFIALIVSIAYVVIYTYTRSTEVEPSSRAPQLEPFDWYKTTQEQRRGKLFCVASSLGPLHLSIVRGFCDYLVYPGPELINGQLVHPLDSITWRKFINAAGHSNTYVPGVDIHSGGASKPESLLTQLDQLTPLLANLTASGVTALGALNVDVNIGVDVLQNAFSAMHDALETYEHGETFLGVELKTSREKEEFVKNVEAMQDVDIVILQTHLSRERAGSSPCVVRPISAVSSQSAFDVPSFPLAEEAEKELGNRTDRRIYLSSTLGAAWSIGDPGTTQDLTLGQRCVDGDMTDMSPTCDPSTQILRRADNSENMCELALIEYGNQTTQLLTFESRQSLNEKLKRYLKPGLDGWALFEVQRDTYLNCSTIPAFDRLQFVASLVRQPGRG